MNSVATILLLVQLFGLNSPAHINNEAKKGFAPAAINRQPTPSPAVIVHCTWKGNCGVL